jgi:hypothetical protein
MQSVYSKKEKVPNSLIWKRNATNKRICTATGTDSTARARLPATHGVH